MAATVRLRDAPVSHVRRPDAARMRRFLLTCGILGPALYVAMMFFVGRLWEGYSVMSHTISELSAIGAPTRPLWLALGTVYTVLMIGFGWIVWRSSSTRALRIVGALLLVQAVLGWFWPPMHQRAVLAAGGHTLTDTLHVVWMAASGMLFTAIMAFGAAALGGRFRIFSLATLAIVLAGAVATGGSAAAIEADLPTPWVGAWERLSAAGYMAWVAVLAAALLRAGAAARRRVV